MSRTPLVVVPLVALLALSAGTGAHLLLAEPEQADAASRATCWDGSSAPRVRGCSRPRGVEGLAWVFPSIDLDDPRCEGSEEGPRASWRCRAVVAGERVVVRYDVAREVATMLERAERAYRAGARAEMRAPDGSVNRYVWRLAEPGTDGSFVLTAAYRTHPYSVTVRGGSVAARDRALRELVDFRDPAEVRGPAR